MDLLFHAFCDANTRCNTIRPFHGIEIEDHSHKDMIKRQKPIDPSWPLNGNVLTDLNDGFYKEAGYIVIVIGTDREKDFTVGSEGDSADITTVNEKEQEVSTAGVHREVSGQA